ncbi:MAG TPA: hypothetical protein VLR90_01090 [Blastocatellia bacterium]|nr:hypothetical protein [Blastocatellia bacterium]
MKLDECEETVFSVMAEMDGETPILSPEQTARHVTGCERCRAEIERQKAAVNLLQRQKRQTTSTVDLWLEVEKRIREQPISELVPARYFFFLLGAILVIYKLFEMIPAQDWGFWFKLAPLVFVAALFYFFRENPFKINTELKLEG